MSYFRRLRLLQRVLALRAGDAAKADALAVEDKRRAIEELDRPGQSGDMNMFELASYRGKRRKLVDGISDPLEMNRQGALADLEQAATARPTRPCRPSWRSCAARTEPSKTVGAALAETPGNEAKAIAAPLAERSAQGARAGGAPHHVDRREGHRDARAQYDTQLESEAHQEPAPTRSRHRRGRIRQAGQRAGGSSSPTTRSKPADDSTWSAIIASATARCSPR